MHGTECACMRTILCKRLKCTDGCFLALKNWLYFAALFWLLYIVRTDDTIHKILKRLQKPSLWVKVAITREQNFSLQIHESKSKKTWLEAIEAISFRRIATVEQLQLEQTHTQTSLPYPSCGYAINFKQEYSWCRLKISYRSHTWTLKQWPWALDYHI